jgi:hypothetical protein
VRTLWLALALCAAAGAQAQQPAGERTDVQAEPKARAPLEDAGAIEPAVTFDASTKAPSTPVVPATPRPAPSASAAGTRTARRSGAMDRLDLGTTSITGNQELPKVLYIVPWKQSDLGDLVGRPVNTLLDEVLAPLDPAVFERRLDYYETLYGDSEKE